MTKAFDLLSQFAKFGRERKMSLQGRDTLSAFIGHVGDEVEGALGDEALLYGQRTEAMFEALLVSLGEYELLKTEDCGRLFSIRRYVAPDFRVVLRDGEHWLIEVKNVYEKKPSQQRRRLFSGSYLERLSGYAEATGAELKIAVYWARWSIWTLVSPRPLIGDDGNLELEMPTAIRVNELSRLGDRIIGTRSPLRLRLIMDLERTSTLDADGKVDCVIGDVKAFCGDQELTEPDDQSLAWMFMLYGQWREYDPEAILDGDRLLAIEFRWEPEQTSDQGFEIVGTLSRMFARYYAEHTVEDGKVVQLRAPLRPNWFVPLVERKGGSKALPLWQFVQEPGLGDHGDTIGDGFSP